MRNKDRWKGRLRFSKRSTVEQSFLFLLWKLWLALHNKQMPKDTHVKKSFSFLLWKLWLTLHNKKIPKETHVENSFSFLLIPKPTCFRKCLMAFFTGICLWHTVQGNGFFPEWVFCWFLNLHALENFSRHSLQGHVCDILYKYMASLLNESFVDS